MKKIISLIFILSLTACTVDIYPQQIKIAEEYCSDKGGIYKIQTNPLGESFVTCKDSLGKYKALKTN
jgi:putative hemolysin